MHRRRRSCRPVRAPPGTTERVDRELAGCQRPLELRAGHLHVDRIRCRLQGPTRRIAASTWSMSASEDRTPSNTRASCSSYGSAAYDGPS